MTSTAQLQTVVFEGPMAVERLHQLALTCEGLQAIVEDGEYARAEATENDPITAAGTNAYQYRVRGLRHEFCSAGLWKLERSKGLEMIVSPCGKRCVITRGGTGGVGMRFGFPQPRRRVGTATKGAFKDNATLMLDPNWLNDVSAPTHSRETWILLVERAEDVVRSELSLPSGIADGQARGWLQRILLPEIDLTDPNKRAPIPGDEPIAFDPPATRKRG